VSLLYLLDTSVFLSAALDGLDVLPRKVRAILMEEGNELLLSTISITEIALKHGAGKLAFGARETKQALTDLRIRLLPYDIRHTFQYFDLSQHTTHKDPFDRMIIATALQENVPILTSDRQFKAYRNLQVIW
jgi:PIN domain nuclease of toxin-antitoxin system